MLMGCGGYVDFVPRNNPHFVGPTIVLQHRLIGTSLRDGDEREIKKMPTAENVRGLSQKP